MIGLARDNPAFRATVEQHDSRRARRDPARRVRGRRARARKCAKLQRAGRADGRSRPARQRGRDRRTRRCSATSGRCARPGLNIMMSMKGDGKPVSFIEDCAVPLEHLAEYTDRLTQRVRQARHARHVVRARVGRLPARAARSSTCGRRRRAPRCARSPRKRARSCSEYKGAYSGEHGDGLVRSEWIEPMFGPRLDARVRGDQGAFDPKGLMNPGKIVRRRRWTTARCSASSPDYRDRCRSTPRSTGRSTTVGEANRGRGFAGGRRDVQQQRPLPQVRRRHDVPVVSRDARRAARHARPREHAAPRALGPARRRRLRVGRGARHARSLRLVQGLQARMPDRRRHGENEDRVPAPLPASVTGCTLQGPAGRASAALRAVGRAAARRC